MDDFLGKRKVKAKVIAQTHGCSSNHILNLFKEGTIPGYKMGRLVLFDPDEVNQAFEAFKRPVKKVFTK